MLILPAVLLVFILVAGIVGGLVYLFKKGHVFPALGILAIGLVLLAMGWFLLAVGTAKFETVESRAPVIHSETLVTPQRSQPPAQDGSGSSESRGKTSGDRQKSQQAVTIFTTFPWTITGQSDWETTSDKAIEGALKDAQEKIVAQFEAQRRPLSWEPPLSYIRKHLVKAEPIIEKQEFEPAGEWKRARVTIEMNETDTGELERLASEHRAEQRKAVAESRLRDLARCFACLIAGLATVGVYSHLQQSTQGRYTWPLRLAAVGFVIGMVVVVLGIG